MGAWAKLMPLQAVTPNALERRTRVRCATLHRRLRSAGRRYHRPTEHHRPDSNRRWIKVRGRQYLKVGERPVSLIDVILALLWQIFAIAGFPNHFFCDSWVVGFLGGRPWLAGNWIGKTSLDVGSSRFWIGWVTKDGDKCARSTCRD